MKHRMEYSPEIRQASLRLLEMWQLTTGFTERCDEIVQETWDAITSPATAWLYDDEQINAHGNIADELGKIQNLREEYAIAEKYNHLMSAAWENLLDRDQFILTPYRMKANKGDKVTKVCRTYSVSHNMAFQYKETALKHLWNNVLAQGKKEELYNLIHDWGTAECRRHGRTARKISSDEVTQIVSNIMGLGIASKNEDQDEKAVYPLVSIDIDDSSAATTPWPGSLQIRLFTERRNAQLEHQVEDMFLRKGFLFQIFRLRGQGNHPIYQAIYVFPLAGGQVSKQTEAA